MALPDPRLSAVQSVLQFSGPAGREPARDEAIVQGVKSEFPNVVLRQYLPPDAPAIAPHLVLSSTSSQLAVSAVAAQFQVQFYGDYLGDVELGIEYVERKLSAVLAGLRAAEIEPATVGVVAAMHFPFSVGEEQAVIDHILGTHLREAVDPSQVQDAVARVAVRIRDTYFVTLTIKNYETRIVERPIFPGMATVSVRPWEGRVEEVGIELGIDINNNLEARTTGTAVVTDAGIEAMSGLLRELAVSSGPRWADTADLDIAALTERSLA
jgi:hypothetical protein